MVFLNLDFMAPLICVLGNKIRQNVAPTSSLMNLIGSENWEYAKLEQRSGTVFLI
jgi:hypothetical protein